MSQKLFFLISRVKFFRLIMDYFLSSIVNFEYTDDFFVHKLTINYHFSYVALIVLLLAHLNRRFNVLLAKYARL